MIFREEKVKDFPNNHLFADIWFLSGDGVMAFLSLYIKIVFHLLSTMSISIEWSAQGDKWLLRRGGEGALCRIGGHCSHHAHRTQYIHKHTQHSHIFIIFHSYIFHTFSYFFIHFHIMEGTVVIMCIAHNIFINIQQSHFYRCSCRPWKVLHNPEAVPKCGYFAPQWNVNNSSFMLLCFLGF